MNKLEIALIGRESSWLSGLSHQHIHLQHFSSPLDVCDIPSLILLNAPHKEEQLPWLQRLRAHPDLGNLLIFSLQAEESLDMESKILLDGFWQSFEIIEAKVSEWQQRMKLFQLQHPDPAIQHVMAYMWPREQHRLIPKSDWHAPQLYRYALLECITGSDDEAALLLHRLQARNLISPDRLIDRIRNCNSCRSSHLSYIDQCPFCQSLDIKQQPAIHCFNCGHVSRQESFIRNGVLQCPNCHTRLRHIGSDYDRPMENFHCNSCNNLFIEPDVRARCMQCGDSNKPDVLNIELIYDYQLSVQGRLLCRHGETMTELSELAQLTTLGLIPQELFRFTLFWIDQLAARYPKQGYSLMAWRLVNVIEVVKDRGYQHAMQIITALAERLRSQLRDTDLTTRTADDLYWLLLPNTAAQGIARLKEKILSTLSESQQGGGTLLRAEIACYSSKHVQHDVQDISLLMDTLANEVSL